MEIPEDLEITLQEIRSQWEFASICQFLNLFYNAVGLESFDTDEFETDLVTGKSNANIIKLQMKLLKSLTGLNNILLDNYQNLIIKEYKKHNLDCSITEKLDFFDLPIREKIMILYNLCEWQFENADNFRARITEEDQQTWRVDPIGYDQKGNKYWLFDDNRLYKELPEVIAKPKPRKGKRRHRRDTTENLSNSPAMKQNRWQLVCLTSEDWNNFPKQFENSKYQIEKDFYEFVTTYIIPKVLDALKSKEKKRRLQEAIVHRKRSSRIQMKEIEKFEKERKAELERLRKEEELKIKREEEKRRKEEERLRQIQLERERRIKEREEKIRLKEEQKQKEREEQMLREMRCRRNEEGPGINGEPFEFKCICNNNEIDIEHNEVPLIVCEQCNVWMHIPCLAMKLLRFTEQPLLLYEDDIEDWKRILFICPRCKAKELNIDYDKVINKKKRGRPKLSEEEIQRKKQENSENKKQIRKRRKITDENGVVFIINDGISNSDTSASNSNNIILDSNDQPIKLSKYKLKKLEETPEEKAERERLKQERKELRRKLRLEKKLQLKLERREQRRKERLERKEQEKLQKKMEREKLRQEKKEKLQMEKLIEKMKKRNLVVFGPVGPDGQPPLLVPNQLRQHRPKVKKQSLSKDNDQLLGNNYNSISSSVTTSVLSEGSV
ncbi:hypothetical protein BCR36DRAFT_280672 [Piromyces finnis]|uniref:Zinc finger PHD-type domain-containing protein n=1 Tax=Piromyces finnis TaxID=1754191 RepID=A0A1Y1VH88_9FUNG|nr:hypothetical protein BCR36DRAFT_280672 [Piromyces finnis]|eukprot:ORX56020.1 hypothetical protein BCR36DRAFT_280672 [Piromyces finnis]